MDILQMLQKAIQDEQASEALYRRWAEEAQDAESRAVFEAMAQDERRHQEVLREKLLARKLKRQR